MCARTSIFASQSSIQSGKLTLWSMHSSGSGQSIHGSVAASPVANRERFWTLTFHRSVRSNLNRRRSELSSNLAPVGSTVWILGTGGGVFTPSLSTGMMAPLSPLSNLALPVTVTLDGGIPASVVYAGSSPTAPSGVFQINFVVPPVFSGESSHNVYATIGSVPTGQVSIAIR
jgi:uncharacterized protein (TIGR03437 family)